MSVGSANYPMAALSTDSSADEDSYVSDGETYADAAAFSTMDTKRKTRDSSYSGFINSFSSFPAPYYTLSPPYNLNK